MHIPPVPHRWTVSPKEAVRIQRRLAVMVRVEPLDTPVRTVVGVDAAYSRDGGRCIAGAVLWDAETHVVLEERVAVRSVRFPYVPGLLSFREAPAVVAALRKIRREPDVIMCDAHGVAHPRRFGLASHLGVLCELPTLGCAKSVLVGRFAMPAPRRGARTALREGRVRIGTVLRTRTDVKPIFVSVGHRIDLGTAERVALACATAYRMPEPTRLADRLVSRQR